jgi:hypothetical protein
MRFIWCLPCLILSFLSSAQTYTLSIGYADSSSHQKPISYYAKTKTERELQTKQHVQSLYQQGYILATIEQQELSSDSLLQTISIRTKQKIKWTQLRVSETDKSLLSKLRYNLNEFENRNFNYQEYIQLSEKILGYYENMGYPFATVELDSIRYTSDGIGANLKIDKHKFFKLDSIIIIGSAKINTSFLEHYLNVFEGKSYNEKNLKTISSKLKQLAFLQEKQPQQVRLTDKINKLYLFLDKKNASQFDGIIGILPDNATGKTVFTGDVKIKLVNGIFKNGETFDLEWRRLQTQTQDFKGRVIYPYLFKTPIGTDYSLKIYRKDSSFIDVINNVGLQYYFSGLSSCKVFFKQRNTNLISTNNLQFINTLPDYADITTQSYGLGLNFEQLDYRFNPHKGIRFISQAATGTRSIKKNVKVNELAYEGLKLLSTQHQLEGDVDFFIRLRKHNVIHIGIQSGGIIGNSTIFRNELFRIGGLKTIRGFDEESIFASTFVIPTLEYRYLFAQNSNILVFAEGAWYENNSLGNYFQDTPISFGAGINIETKAGILSLNYGIGRQLKNDFDFRNGKIHFGLTALF